MDRNAYKEILKIKLQAKTIELIEAFYNNIFETLLSSKENKIESNGYIFRLGENNLVEVVNEGADEVDSLDMYSFDELYNMLFKKGLEE